MSDEISSFLSNIPAALRAELLDTLHSIQRNFREARWEPSELNGGKLCEVVYCIIRGFADGNYPPKSSKPSNIVDACNAMTSAGAHLPRSIRIQIPRMIIALYEIRNNRGVGHVGGDVNPNLMDATCVLNISKWIVSELVRVFHDCDVVEAERVIEAISYRNLPLIWEVNGTLRVLDTSLTLKQQTLALLYHSSSGLSEDILFSSLEQKNKSNYRRDVLSKLHKARLIDFDKTSKLCVLSPTGVSNVEAEILSA